jgi:hypothetical protein
MHSNLEMKLLTTWVWDQRLIHFELPQNLSKGLHCLEEYPIQMLGSLSCHLCGHYSLDHGQEVMAKCQLIFWYIRAILMKFKPNPSKTVGEWLCVSKEVK